MKPSMSKKAEFQHVKIKLSRGKFIRYFCLSVPSTFDKDFSSLLDMNLYANKVKQRVFNLPYLRT